MKILTLIIAVLFLSACNEQQKEFKDVTIGMTRQEVSLKAGEPSSKKNVGPIELWSYKVQNRTVVFKNDTVFNVITSSEARVDSIGISLKEAGDDLKKEADKAVGKIDSLGKSILNKIL